MFEFFKKLRFPEKMYDCFLIFSIIWKHYFYSDNAVCKNGVLRHINNAKSTATKFRKYPRIAMVQ